MGNEVKMNLLYIFISFFLGILFGIIISEENSPTIEDGPRDEEAW